MDDVLLCSHIDCLVHGMEHLFCLRNFSLPYKIFELLGEGLQLRLERLTPGAADRVLLCAFNG